MQTGNIKAGWQGNDHIIELDLPVFNFEDENGIHYAMLPSLDITGYGKTEEEADESLKIMLHEYLHYTTEHQTLAKDLERHRWQIRRKNVQPPDIAKLICKNDQLNDLLTSHDFRKSSQSVSLPAFA